MNWFEAGVITCEQCISLDVAIDAPRRYFQGPYAHATDHVEMDDEERAHGDVAQGGEHVVYYNGDDGYLMFGDGSRYHWRRPSAKAPVENTQGVLEAWARFAQTLRAS